MKFFQYVLIVSLGFACFTSKIFAEKVSANDLFNMNKDSLLITLEQRANQDDTEAQTVLGTLYLTGKYVSKDYGKALGWLEKASEKEDINAYTLLVMVIKEEGEEIIKAANQGDKGAQFLLGMMYCDGRGVSKNLTKTIEWYTKSADQGYAHAQVALGLMYATGVGVAHDDSEAFKWYNKAAAQENASAQLLLGHMYSDGRGVSKDSVKAKEYYKKSCLNQDKLACDFYKELSN